MGDFNDMTTEDEKFGGNPVSSRRILAYKGCMDYCNLMDIGFSGPKFTWTNMKGMADLIQERLDRCWINADWKLLFPEASVQHLVHINSDHCPLLLNLDSPPPQSSDRPFRFQPMWLSHPKFPLVVRDAWVDRDFDLPNAIVDFTIKARVWNKDIFGNIHVRKKRLLA